MIIAKIDEQGLFIEDILIKDNEETPTDCIEIPCPEGFHRPKWDGIGWVEGLTQEEIDAIKNAPKEPTETELLQQKVAQLEQIIDTMLTGGTI